MANLNIPFLIPSIGEKQMQINNSSAKFLDGNICAIQKNNKTNSLERLFIVPDQQNGEFYICSHQQVLASNTKNYQINNFVINLQPKIFCIPQLYQNNENMKEPLNSTLIDFCQVKSPAKNILSTSKQLLVTLHQNKISIDENENIIRLWNTNDGRCIMNSPRNLFSEKRIPIRIISMNEHFSDNQFNGLVLCVCQNNEFLIINVFTMIIVEVFTANYINALMVKIESYSLNIDFLKQQQSLFLTIFDSNSNVMLYSFYFISDIQDTFENDEANFSSPVKNQILKNSFKQSSSIMLDQLLWKKYTLNNKNISNLCKIQTLQIVDQFSKKESKYRGAHQQILDIAINNDSSSSNLEQIENVIVLFQDRIEYTYNIKNQQNLNLQKQVSPLVLLQYEKDQSDLKYDINQKQKILKEKWFIFGKIYKKYEQEDLINLQNNKIQQNEILAICIDSELNLIIYDVNKLIQIQQLDAQPKHLLQNDNTFPAILFQTNIFKNAQLFNFNKKNFINQITFADSNFDLEMEYMQLLKAQFVNEIQKNQTFTFQFDISQKIIYTFTRKPNQSKLINEHLNILLSWSLNDILDKQIQQTRIPLNIFEFKNKQQSLHNQEVHGIININPYVNQNYFSQHQHNYFYSDEYITQKSFYQSSEFSSCIIGTNYGRIFIIQIFQDIEGRAYPVLVLDCHAGQSISCLYIAYSPARKFKTQQDKLSQANYIQTDTGGYLIASSVDGTLSITNLNSKEIVDQLQNFKIRRNKSDLIKKRADQMLNSKYIYQKQERRHSISDHYQLSKCFNLVKIKPFKVFQNITFGIVSQIIEVQIIQQNFMDRQNQQKQIYESSNSQIENSQFQDQIQDNYIREQKQKEYQSHSADHVRELTLDGTINPNLGQTNNIQNNYTYHLDFINELSSAQNLESCNPIQLIEELIPFKSLYACIDTTQNSVCILSIQSNNCDILQINGLDSRPIGVYEDVLQNLIHVVTNQNLNVYSYNKKSKRLVRKSGYQFAQSLLQFNQIVNDLMENQQYFVLTQKIQKQDKNAVFDQYSYRQQFVDSSVFQQKSKTGLTQNVGSTQQGSSQHSVLDYLQLSLQLPLYYHPHNMHSQKYTKTIKDLVMDYNMLNQAINTHALQQQFLIQNAKNQVPTQSSQQKVNLKEKESIQIKAALRKIIFQQFVWNDRYKSDFNKDHYQSQGGVTMLHSQKNYTQEQQENIHQILIINTKDMVNILKHRMRTLTESQRHQQPADKNSKQNLLEQSINFPEYFQNNKWPTRLLSLVHPFMMDENLDQNLELFFGICKPFLVSLIGIQGTDESFSFVMPTDQNNSNSLHTTDDFIYSLKSKLNDEISASQSFKLSKLSIIQKKLQFQDLNISQNESIQNISFLNNEFWTTSSYMNTIMSSFFLSTLVSIVEYAQSDITTLIQDWLNLIHYITSESTIQSGLQKNIQDKQIQELLNIKNRIEPEILPLSISVLSQLVLRKDQSLSSCARDILLKPLLSNGNQMISIKQEINEWQDLIMDTYLNLKQESLTRHANDPHGKQQVNLVKSNSDQSKYDQQQLKSSQMNQQINIQQKQFPLVKSKSIPNDMMEMNNNIYKQVSEVNIQQPKKIISNELKIIQSNEHQDQKDKNINQYFGELEMRGLINMSYYSLYSMECPEKFKIPTDIQNRLCKCTVILTREIMSKFTANSREYQNLLTILMYLLQTQLRAKVPTFKIKVIKEDVIKILLLVYDFHKKQLKDERFLTRVVAENFHLIYPKNSELHLKLTAAKNLLEIGTHFTDDFLYLIDQQATTLKDGPEYQRNVLDVLRYFINGSKDNLEQYLIQIVQTLLKCLDPKDEQLRKNSTQLISIILSTMVKGFSMIAFHHETQRLAVGTPNGVIAIYDVRTSSKWKVLEGHTSRVLAVDFDSKGNLLASYSAIDLSLRIWKVGNAGFFQTIMGGNGKIGKEFILKPLVKQNVIQNKHNNIIQGNKFGNQKIQMKKYQSEKNNDQSQQVKGVRCQIRFLDNDKIVQLTREDGSIEEFKINK